MFDTFLGLPLHPLVVHAAVVLLPLVAIGVIALAVKPAWRPRFAVALLGLLIVGGLSGLVAMLSGERLADRVGEPAQHAQLGTILGYSSLAFLIIAGAWLWWVRGDDEPTPAQNGTGWAVTVVSLAVIVLAAMVGHSGATAAWSDAVAQPAPATSAASPTPEPVETSAPETSAAPPATATTSAETTTPQATESATAATYTVDMLAQHNTVDSCWAAIDGSMYDLTEWVSQHPGGPERIISLCGTDATDAFSNQHAGQPNPAEHLSQYLLGPLS